MWHPVKLGTLTSASKRSDVAQDIAPKTEGSGKNLTIFDTPETSESMQTSELSGGFTPTWHQFRIMGAPLVSWANAPAAVQSPSWLQEDDPEWSFHRGEFGKINENHESPVDFGWKRINFQTKPVGPYGIYSRSNHWKLHQTWPIWKGTTVVLQEFMVQSQFVDQSVVECQESLSCDYLLIWKKLGMTHAAEKAAKSQFSKAESAAQRDARCWKEAHFSVPCWEHAEIAGGAGTKIESKNWGHEPPLTPKRGLHTIL